MERGVFLGELSYREFLLLTNLAGFVIISGGILAELTFGIRCSAK